MSQSSHWTQHAAQWARVGPPLRPVAQDVALFRRALALDDDAAPVALLLGATSELVDLPWPAATRLFAADRSLPMLLAQRPQWRFAGQWLVALNADWRALPLAAASVDGIVGDGALTTLPDMTQVARVGAECARVLRPGGLLLFSSFGPDTLLELREAWAAVDTAPRVSLFADMPDLAAALQHARFSEPVLDADRLVRHYPDVRALMDELRAIGARNAAATRARGLTGPRTLARMIGHYETRRSPQGIPATWEVFYGAAFAGGAAPPGAIAEQLVPVSSLRRRPRAGVSP